MSVGAALLLETTMRTILTAALMLCLGGCATTGHFYPDHASAPADCKIRDGYCYRVIEDPSKPYRVNETYQWTPKNGWKLIRREDDYSVDL